MFEQSREALKYALVALVGAAAPVILGMPPAALVAIIGVLGIALATLTWTASSARKRSDRRRILEMLFDADGYAAGLVEHVPHTTNPHASYVRLPYVRRPSLELDEGVLQRNRDWLSPRLLANLKQAVDGVEEFARTYGHPNRTNVRLVAGGTGPLISLYLHHEQAEHVWQDVVYAIELIAETGGLDYTPSLPQQRTVEQYNSERRARQSA